jgi:cysteine-rich repeat protein
MVDRSIALRLMAAAVLLIVAAGRARAQVGGPPVCGNGIVEANEQCDDGAKNGTSGSCCTVACVLAPTGTECGPAPGPCSFPSVCFDGACFDVQRLDGAPCDDGNPCTVGDVCMNTVCVPGTATCSRTVSPPPTPLPPQLKPGTLLATVDCSVPGGAGGTCSAAAFLPEPAAGALRDATTASSADIACDFTREITRSTSRTLDQNGMAQLKLKLNKLARRLIRKLPVTAMLRVNVCTKISLAGGSTVTLVDVVDLARRTGP